MKEAVHLNWDRIKERMKSEFGGTQYKHWLEPVQLHSVSGGVVTLAVKSNSTCDWVRQHYGDRLKALWSQEDPAVHQVEICVRNINESMAPPANSNTAEAAPVKPRPAPLPAQPVARPVDDELTASLDPRYTFDNFVTGKPNEFAFAAAQRVADSTVAQFNPLFLYGGVGLGKTHLMHAIAWHISSHQPERRVLYLSAEKFMYRFVRALKDKSTFGFKEEFRSADILMVDDVQFLAGKESTQEEFFHTFNALIDQGRQIVVSADKSPGEIADLEERLRSRLGSGLIADIHNTDYELRLGILEAKSERENIILPKQVAEFLASKITSNVRDLEGALIRVIAHAQLVHREITLEMVQDVLRDLLRSHDKKVTINDIQRKVAEHFQIKLADLLGPRRSRALARPRQIAMYLSKELTQNSLPEIGRQFGGRDHTTVMHAVKQVNKLKAEDPNLEEDVTLLASILAN